MTTERSSDEGSPTTDLVRTILHAEGIDVADPAELDQLTATYVAVRERVAALDIPAARHCEPAAVFRAQDPT